MSTATQVPDIVLAWLHNSLTPSYEDVNRTYGDVARTLALQSTLAPRTDTFTHEDGSSRLLLHLHGTLPVAFRGAVYQFPLSVWVPHAYPREPPMIFIDPDPSLVVRPGQHVSAEGRVYHPYLAHWQSHWGRSNIVDALTMLQGVFAKEPPVGARVDGSIQQSNPLPPPQRMEAGTLASGPSSRPPPPPPKTLNDDNRKVNGGVASSLPPRPPKVGQFADLHHTSSVSSSHPTRMHDYRFTRAQPSSNLPEQQSRRSAYNDEAGRGGPLSLSYSAELPGQTQPRGHYNNAPAPGPSTMAAIPEPSSGSNSGPVQQNSVRMAQPVQDLMSSPLEIPAATQQPNMNLLAAPPIPRNPEKDALFDAISRALRAQLEESVTRNTSALPALEAQQTALQAAMHNMQSEKYHLDELNEVLTNNEQIVQDSIIEAESAVENVKQREVPNVDDVLVAPTVVAEQLYKLVADERSIGDALFTLTKALDRGRLTSDVFIKQTRSLAREQFLHKALTKKIARGMGLVNPMAV